MQSRKGIDQKKPSRPRRKFLVLLAIAVIMSGLLGLTAPAPAATICGGEWHSLGLTAGGNVVAWGDNTYGQRNIPSSLTGVVAIGAGNAHNMALKADGTVVAWGWNGSGQTDVPGGLNGVVAVAAGYYHSLALKDDGTVVAWGGNQQGQTTVPDGAKSGVVAVAAGRGHSLALKADGTVVAWGDNFFGQTSVPAGLSGVVAVAAGDHHSLALKADGTVVAWGYNVSGQCEWPGETLALAPVAKIDPHEAVAPNTLVTLNGGQSCDYDNNTPLMYHWEITNVPPGWLPELKKEAYWTTSSSYNFTPNVAGEYRVMLLVKDSMGIYSNPVWATVPVNANTPPLADAGLDQAITLIGSTVQLDGSQSYDPDGDPIITYQWTFSSWPGSDASPPTTQPTLTGETTATPTFVAGVQGTYTLQLVVNDGQADSAPSFVTVSFENIKPVANAGGNQAKVVGDTVTLNGSGTDANGDPLTYQWSLVSAPAGSSVALNAATATASFIADLPGDYVVGLTVNDGFVNSDPNNITVTVITKQNAATENLASTVDVVNSLPPETLPTVFVNSNQANALTNKINAALKLIDQKQYAAALDKLQTDILPKTDGCATQGKPDNNDWIKDCATQQQVYTFVKQTIEFLQGLQ